MKKPRDKRCAHILETVIAYKRRNDGCAPSHRQLGDWLGGLSTNIIAYHLRHLEEDDLVATAADVGTSRTIKVAGASWVPYNASILVEALETVAEEDCCGTPGCCLDDPKCTPMLARAALREVGLWPSTT